MNYDQPLAELAAPPLKKAQAREEFCNWINIQAQQWKKDEALSRFESEPFLCGLYCERGEMADTILNKLSEMGMPALYDDSAQTKLAELERKYKKLRALLKDLLPMAEDDCFQYGGNPDDDETIVRARIELVEPLTEEQHPRPE